MFRCCVFGWSGRGGRRRTRVHRIARGGSLNSPAAEARRVHQVGVVVHHRVIVDEPRHVGGAANANARGRDAAPQLVRHGC